VKQIVAAIPTAHTIVLPAQWFETLSDNVSVFESLYKWLVETRRVEPKRLHNRTYAGATVAKRLHAAERRRIARRFKLKGKALEKAVNFSDLDSGPLTLFAEWRLLGNVLIVLPDDDEKIEKVITEMLIENWNRQNRKIQALASGADFGQWLVSNTGREDPIGDLAHDAIRDPNFLRSVRHYQEARKYLEGHGACSEALYALVDAWKEYADKYPDRIVQAAWCAQCEREISDLRDGILAWTKLDEFNVFHNACLIETPEHKVSLQQLLLDDPEFDGVTAFAAHCTAPQESVDDIKTRLRLWGFGKQTSGSHRTIYFVQEKTSGQIKIGITSLPIKQRLASLQTANPNPLCLIATLDGDRVTETELHQRFQSLRRSGEWFNPDPDLIQFIVELTQT
jgi:uncharacterized protein YozE (UPF0346 family)